MLYPDKDLGYTSVCISQNLVSIHLKSMHFIVHDCYRKRNMNFKQIRIFMLKYLGENCTEVCNSLCNASTNKWADGWIK